MFDIMQIISELNVGESLDLLTFVKKKDALIVEKTQEGFIVWEQNTKVAVVGGELKMSCTKTRVKNAIFTLVGLGVLRFGGKRLSDMGVYTLVVNPRTFQSLPKFNPEEDLELFVISNLGRYFICGMEGFLFEIPEEEVEGALLRLPVQKLLSLRHLNRMPMGLEQYI